MRATSTLTARRWRPRCRCPGTSSPCRRRWRWSPASCQAPHNGPSLRKAIAEVGHSSETNSSSAPPPAVRPATVTSAGPSPRTDKAGARSSTPARLRSLSVIYLRYHRRPGTRKGAAAALSPPLHPGGTIEPHLVRPRDAARRWHMLNTGAGPAYQDRRRHPVQWAGRDDSPASADGGGGNAVEP